ARRVEVAAPGGGAVVGLGADALDGVGLVGPGRGGDGGLPEAAGRVEAVVEGVVVRGEGRRLDVAERGPGRGQVPRGGAAAPARLRLRRGFGVVGEGRGGDA